MMYRLLRAWACLLLLLAPGLAQETPKVDIKILAPGEGQPVQRGDKIALSYKLNLEDGTLIEETPADSSYDMVIGSGEVIPGLSQGVEGMLPGERRQILIPAELAYGAKKNGKIPPNSRLNFQVELLYTISKRKAEPKAQDDHDGHHHAHDENDGHHHFDGDEMFGEDGALNRPTANETTNMAMMEFMLREFFTSPWRLPHANLRIWKKTGLMGLILLLLLALGALLNKNGKAA